MKCFYGNTLQLLIFIKNNVSFLQSQNITYLIYCVISLQVTFVKNIVKYTHVFNFEGDVMRILIIILYCGLQLGSMQLCLSKSNDRYSIRINTTSDLTQDSWEINLQQCLEKKVKSCEILIADGLKNIQECLPKKQCSLIGEIYFYANSLSISKPFFEKACDNKDMQGCYYIGLYHEKQKDYQEAKKLYEKACDKKNMSGCFRMGSLYHYGKGVRQDYEVASQFYKRACKYEQPEACYSLGILHENGEGLEHDLSLAKEFYGKACDLGYQEGCDRYRELNQLGIPSLYYKKNVF